MKARVKETGEIVNVKDSGSVFRDGALFHGYVDDKGFKYLTDELVFDVTDKDCIYNKGWQDGWNEAVKSEIPKIHPKLKNSDHDYWEKLKHQYAGMAMNALLLTNNVRNGDLEGMRECNTNAMAIAYALVEKLKNE